MTKPPSHAAQQQKTIDDMVGETLLGSLMSLVRQELAAAQKPWQAMSEEEQADSINRIEMCCRQAVTKAAKIIASDDRASVTAKLEQLTVKDGIKAVLKLPKDTASTQFLSDSVGKSVLLVFVDPELHMGGADTVTADPNQRALLADSGKTQH